MPFGLGFFAVAGAGAPALPTSYDLLETINLTSTASSVTFSNINTYTQYRHLQLRVAVREPFSSTGYTDLIMRINGDTTTAYDYHQLRGRHTNVVVSDTTNNQPNIRIRCNPTDASSIFGGAIIDILDFSNTSKNKTVRALSGVYTDTESQVAQTSGLWRNTNAITSLSFVPVYGTLGIGSRWSLYGLK